MLLGEPLDGAGNGLFGVLVAAPQVGDLRGFRPLRGRFRSGAAASRRSQGSLPQVDDEVGPALSR